MPQFKDPRTGRIESFDHEPTEAELDARFGGGAPAGAPAPAAPEEEDHLGRDIATKVALPMAGFSAGGAVGGKPGAILGAVGGTAYGDLYNTLKDHGSVSTLNPFGGPMKADTSQLGPNAPPSMIDEVEKLLGVGAGAAVGAYGAPHLAKLPGPISLKTLGIGAGGGYMAGQSVGHPGIGAALGAGMGAYNALSGLARGGGMLADYLTTPKFGPAAAESANGLSAADSAGLTKLNYDAPTQARIAAAQAAAGARPIPVRVPTAEPEAGPSMMDRLKGAGSSAIDMLKGLAGKFGVEPEPPPTAYIPQGKAVPYSISEDMLPDASHVMAPSGGQSGMVYPNLTREPNLKYSADVEASPMRPVPGPNLTQTSPTDPEMAWDEYTGRTSPRRSSSSGRGFGSVEVEPHPSLKGLEEVGSSIIDPKAQSIRDQTGGAYQAPPIGVHDVGLQRWLETGGTPEGYEAARGRLQGASGPVGAPEGYGPNSVGAAQKKFVAPTPQPRREFPLGWTPDTPLSKWNEMGANDAEAHAANDPGTQDLMDRLQVIIRNALDSAKR